MLFFAIHRGKKCAALRQDQSKKKTILRGSNCAVGLGLNLVRPRSCSTLLAWSTFVERRPGAQCWVRVVVGSRFVSLHEVASKSILTPRICQHRFGPDRMNWLPTQDGCLISSFPSLNIRFKRLNPRNFTRLRFFFWETWTLSCWLGWPTEVHDDQGWTGLGVALGRHERAQGSHP